MVFRKQHIKPVQKGNPLMPGSVDTDYWFTGNMIESLEQYPGIKTREGKLTPETRGREVCLVPEIRHLPNSRKERQFTAFYTTKERIKNEEGNIEVLEDVLSRAEYYKSKGWLPLEECPEDIQKMVKIMHKHNKKHGEDFVPGKEKYKPVS